MIEKVFSIGDFAISPFGVMLVAAFFAAYSQLRWGLERLGAGDDEDASTMVFAAGLGGILGGKAYYAALYGDWSLLFDRAGLVWAGGFLGGLLGAIIVMRRRRMPTWPTLDAAGLGLALGYAVGRVGCFLVGDDYGRPTDLPWGMTFEVGVPPTTAGNLREYFGIDVGAVAHDAWVAVHPTQLYETALALGIWWFGRRLFRLEWRPGMRFSVLLGLLACERFAVEFLRAKDDRFLGPFTMAQAISVGLLLVASTLFVLRRRSSDPALVASHPA